MPKNIVICCDGTANEATGESTNVLRLYRSLVRDARQLCYYDGGVGTLTDPRALTRFRKLFRKYLDAAIGISIRDNFIEAYTFLVRHYEPGDTIYLFGFSRGAYTVRAVAGAIRMLGLLRPELEGQVPYVWAIYADEEQSGNARRRFGGGARFKKCFARAEDVGIHFVGVFDTVSSVGWIWDWRSLPFTADNDAVAHIRHAVSIDERRACYGANLFRPSSVTQHRTFKEVWFPGCHCDVGGGYPESESALSKLTLQWMTREAEAFGLITNAPERDRMIFRGGESGVVPDPRGMLHNSLKPAWWLVELLPRRGWHAGKQRVAWQWPNLFRRRPDPPGPAVSQAAFDRNKSDPTYAPAILQAVGLTIEP